MMNEQPFQPRILIVDDNPAIHEDFRKILSGQGSGAAILGALERELFGESAPSSSRATFRIDSAFQGKEALDLVQKAREENDPYVLAFVDVRMPPGWDGVETLERIWQCCPEMQAVICTAYADYSWDDLMARLGQTDNLLILKKPFETIEVLQMAHALTQKWLLARQAKLRLEDLDRMVQERTRELAAANAQLRREIEERRKAEEQLKASEERFSKAFMGNPMPMAIQTCSDGRFVAMNPSFLELVGYSAEELLNRTATDLKITNEQWTSFSEFQKVRGRLYEIQRKDGSKRICKIWVEPVTLATGPCVLLIIEDVTEQKKLEDQLRQATKMEAIGRLAAGIAHEFNNLLTVIQGHAGLLCSGLNDPKIIHESATRIAQASQRAANLTKQLLAFGRKQPLQFKPVDLNAVIRNSVQNLCRAIGERYVLDVSFAEDIPCARADEASIEQILLNLVLNARDAMPDGGPISIRTGVLEADESVVSRNRDAKPGKYVWFSVTDKGVGIKPELLDKIFDPFFTTKDSGKGTGLGLAAIYGIVQQHRGWIEVTSEVGKGSTFRVVLPLWEGKSQVTITATPQLDKQASALPSGSGETILVVEDEEEVRNLACTALKYAGYKVLEAADGHQALEIWAQYPGQIKVLVTDVVLPNGVHGGELARLLTDKDPNLKVLYISGYSQRVVASEVPTLNETNFLPKPFDSQKLVEMVGKILTSDSASKPAEEVNK